MEIADFHFQRALHTCSEKIIEICQASAIVPDLPHYLYLLLDLTDKDSNLVSTLAQCNLSDYATNDMELQCIFEAREVWRQANRGKVEDIDFFDRLTVVQADEVIIKMPSPAIRHAIYHHTGKAQRRLNNMGGALEYFRKALDSQPNAQHTHLQLARLAKDKNEKSSHLRMILDAYSQAPDSVAITVVLEAVVQTARTGISDVMEKQDFFELAVEVINTAQAEGYGQPFEALGSISRMLWYDKPDIILELSNRLSIPPLSSLTETDKKTTFGVAETMKNIGKSFINNGDNAKAGQWLALAEQYYRTLLPSGGYYATMYAECFILLNRPQDALRILHAITDTSTDRNAHYYHRRAQAYNLNGNSENALADIDRALHEVEETYMSAFLDCKAEIQLNANDSIGAQQSWSEAIELCTNDKFKKALQGKLIHHFGKAPEVSLETVGDGIQPKEK